MATPPVVRGFSIEDYAEFADSLPLLNKLLPALTSMLTGLTTALSRGLSVNDNLQGKLVQAAAVVGGQEVSILWDRPQKPIAVWTAGCWTTKDGVPTAITSEAWRYEVRDGKANVVFAALGGLATGAVYTVTFVGLSG